VTWPSEPDAPEEMVPRRPATVSLADSGSKGVDRSTWPAAPRPAWLAAGDVEVWTREGPLTLPAGSVLVEVSSAMSDYRELQGLWVGLSRHLVATSGAMRGTVLSVSEDRYWDDAGDLKIVYVWPLLLKPLEPRPIPADLLTTHRHRRSWRDLAARFRIGRTPPNRGPTNRP
jgi:hypothetical protein